jgi:hypothetical protein
LHVPRRTGISWHVTSEAPVPSLFRFLLIVGVLAGAVYAAMWGIVASVEPQPREMTQTLPANRLAGK